MSWDMGLDYNKVLRKLRREINKREKNYNDRDKRGLNNLYVLITQLKNGSRIGEAVNALHKFIDEGKEDRDVYVTVEKREDNAQRLIKIPEEVKTKYLHKENIDKSRAIAYAQTFGFNTHSLRYAFIGKLAKDGVSAQSIAKITGHRNLDEILRYTQEVKAHEILGEYVEK